MLAVKGGGKRACAGLIAYAAILVSLSFLTIVLWVGLGASLRDHRSGAPLSPEALGYDMFSARLLTDSVARASISGDRDLGGFMHATEKTVHIATVERIDGRKGARQAYPYVSNFGLQYVLAKHMPMHDPKHMSPVFSWFSIACALAMALVAGGIALFADRRFGRASGAGVLLVFGLSPPMIFHALNPYWMIFLCFLPFMAMLALYPRAQRMGRFCLVAAIAAGLVAIKALTGYEYISTVALGAALPIVFYELEANGGIGAAAIRRILLRSAIVGLFAVLGFAVAAGMHVHKAALLFGSFDKGLMALTLPMSYSGYDTASGIRADVAVSAPGMLATAFETLLARNLLVTVPLYAALIGTWLLLLARFGGSPVRLWNSLEPAHRALVWTWLAALVTSVSWIFLAVRHSAIHPHINWILGYLFAHVFAAMVVGRNWDMLRGPRSGNQVRGPDISAVGA